MSTSTDKRRGPVRRPYLWIIPALLLLALGFTFRDWIIFGYQAIGYPRIASAEAANVVVSGQYAYVTLAEQGLGVFDMSSGKLVKTLAPAPGSESIDDLALANHMLFALDARIPGHLSVYSLADPVALRLASGPVPVEVGPFSGVAAAAGHVVVSGGTSLLSLRTYDPQGALGQEVVTGDFGRGQPDILLMPDGRRGIISSHFSGPYFGLSTLEISAPPKPLRLAGTLELQGAGFTAGGAMPANFPIEGAWAGDTLLVAFGAGLGFIDLRTFDSPRLKRVLDVGVVPVNVDAEGDVAAVVGTSPDPKLVLIDVRSPEEPKVLRSIALAGGTQPTGVALGKEHVVVANRAQGLLVFPR